MGELARKPGCPELPKSPLDLFTVRPSDNYSAVEKWFWPGLGAVASVFSVAIVNRSMKRPGWAGLHKYFITILIGTFLCYEYYGSRIAAGAETAEVLKHYISLHPDDFPPYERKRWKDVYLPFNPIR